MHGICRHAELSCRRLGRCPHCLSHFLLARVVPGSFFRPWNPSASKPGICILRKPFRDQVTLTPILRGEPHSTGNRNSTPPGAKCGLMLLTHGRSAKGVSPVLSDNGAVGSCYGRSVAGIASPAVTCTTACRDLIMPGISVAAAFLPLRASGPLSSPSWEPNGLAFIGFAGLIAGVGLPTTRHRMWHLTPAANYPRLHGGGLRHGGVDCRSAALGSRRIWGHGTAVRRCEYTQATDFGQLPIGPP